MIFDFTVIHHTSGTDTMVEGTLINEINVKFGLPRFTHRK